jgi:hypothetical protein
MKAEEAKIWEESRRAGRRQFVFKKGVAAWGIPMFLMTCFMYPPKSILGSTAMVNQPILAIDYKRPISFCTGETSRILSADITDVEPLGLNVKVEANGYKVTFNPVLLNR